MGQSTDLLVPDIGDFQDVPIVELLVKVGDALTPDTAVVTIESDKASMEIPAEVEGVIYEILVQEGDTVSEGTILLRYNGATEGNDAPVAEMVKSQPEVRQPKFAATSVVPPAAKAELHVKEQKTTGPAAPSVRRLARELGVDLSDVTGSGSKGRLRKEDIQAYVKRMMQAGGQQRAAWEEPEIDFSVFGPIEVQPLGRIQKLSGSQLARNWAAIPHVTSFDEAEITTLDEFRRQLNQEQPVKLTLLPFMIKAAQYTLQSFPLLNSSLQGGQLIIKNYYHIGFAVDTPNGLLVPVIRDVDSKGVVQIASEVAELAAVARKGRLKPEQMQGGTFTISSLGSIGGTHFTPIINAPEVAILALGRTSIQPVWDGSQFLPRLILPLSLSWDHRVLDGVTASRFNAQLCRVLADFRRVIL